jgi:hypothetical protein
MKHRSKSLTVLVGFRAGSAALAQAPFQGKTALSPQDSVPALNRGFTAAQAHIDFTQPRRAAGGSRRPHAKRGGRPRSGQRDLRSAGGLRDVDEAEGHSVKGALLFSRKAKVRQPGVPATVRDTVGAGDDFTAAIVVCLIKSDPPPEIARVACETASLVCAQSGAVPAPVDEIDAR